MTKENSLLLLIFFLLFIIPDGKPHPEPTPKPTPVIDILQMEGYAAFIANEEEAHQEDKEESVTCTCNGTKKVKMIDGNITECPCGNKCTCKAKGEAPTNIELNNKEATTPEAQEELKKKEPLSPGSYLKEKKGSICIVFTDPSWCTPCKMLDEKTFPELKKIGWTFSDKLEENARFYTLDDEDKLRFTYDVADKVPAFVIMKDGVVKDKFYGYIDAITLADKMNKYNK